MTKERKRLVFESGMKHTAKEDGSDYLSLIKWSTPSLVAIEECEANIK